MSSVKSCVWILKEEKADDPYRQVFEEHDYSVHFHSLLCFNYVHLEDLRFALKNSHLYRGVVITSANAFHAMKLALGDGIDTYSIEKWKLFVISHITEEKKPIQFQQVITANGYATNLSSLIIADYQCTTDKRPLLFLCGNLRRDEIPTTFQTHDIPYKELVVYETITEVNNEKKTMIIDAYNKEKPNWIAFFSPSGVKTLLKIFPKENQSEIWNKVSIASVGTTTSDELSKWCNVTATAELPTPQSLFEAIHNQGTSHVK